MARIWHEKEIEVLKAAVAAGHDRKTVAGLLRRTNASIDSQMARHGLVFSPPDPVVDWEQVEILGLDVKRD